MKWEYKVITTQLGMTAEARLDDLGREGWEVATSCWDAHNGRLIYTLKRMIVG